jgi:hypothetical protein
VHWLLETLPPSDEASEALAECSAKWRGRIEGPLMWKRHPRSGMRLVAKPIERFSR